MADLRMERVLWRHGYTVVGVDEAGRGPLAGPVVAGAAILPAGAELPGVNDSKQLSEKKREKAYDRVLEVALGWGVGVVDHQRIDQINIRNATFEAMHLAVQAALKMLSERTGGAADGDAGETADALGAAHLGTAPGEKACLLIDGNALVPAWTGDQRWVIGGDRKVLSIAAGSILAKVTRDRMMVEYDKLYPAYGFAKHKGYSAKEHFAALDAHGPCPIHRMTFIDHRQLKLF